MTTRNRRWGVIALTTIIVLLIVGFAAFQFALRAAKGQIEAALGPHGEVKEIKVGLTGVEILGIRIRAPSGGDAASRIGAWPAEDQLRAERIVVVPSLADLLSSRIVVKSIRIENAYISMLRARDGRMKVIPSLLEASGGAQESGGNVPPISIGRIELIDGTVEFFDATIRRTPVKQRIEQIDARVDHLQLPDLKGRSTIALAGILKGVRTDGKVSINGNIELATKESEIVTRLNGVDLVALQPYLIKATENGVRKGTLDLDLKSTVRKGRLHAPGKITLSNMELASSSASGTIMGMPQQAAVAMMKNRDGKISVKFVLEGNINDPRFSLNENLTTRIATSVAEGLGVSIEGLAKGVESLGSGATKGLTDSLGKLFGR
jgi:hypothetical protein